MPSSVDFEGSSAELLPRKFLQALQASSIRYSIPSQRKTSSSSSVSQPIIDLTPSASIIDIASNEQIKKIEKVPTIISKVVPQQATLEWRTSAHLGNSRITGGLGHTAQKFTAKRDCEGDFPLQIANNSTLNGIESSGWGTGPPTGLYPEFPSTHIRMPSTQLGMKLRQMVNETPIKPRLETKPFDEQQVRERSLPEMGWNTRPVSTAANSENSSSQTKRFAPYRSAIMVDTVEELDTFVWKAGRIQEGIAEMFWDEESGPNHGRNGRLSTIQITLASVSGLTYILDVIKLGHFLFYYVTSKVLSIRRVHENPNIVKVVFDLRADAAALHGQYGINFRGAIDLQLMELATRPASSRGYLLSLDVCVTNHLGLGAEELATWKYAKTGGSHFLNKDFSKWEIRPLPHELLIYAANDTVLMPHLYGLCLSKLRGNPCLERMVIVESARRVAGGQVPGFASWRQSHRELSRTSIGCVENSEAKAQPNVEEQSQDVPKVRSQYPTVEELLNEDLEGISRLPNPERNLMAFYASTSASFNKPDLAPVRWQVLIDTKEGLLELLEQVNKVKTDVAKLFCDEKGNGHGKDRVLCTVQVTFASMTGVTFILDVVKLGKETF
ncbi:hypothetical protein DL98DRAFT_652061 [Cadophora sp. DSE1049]|nr:hypothetical protein DL98DRAFT_652061 [Cadophora sp. DSE1049]